MDVSEYRSRRRQRGDLARRAVHDPVARAALLSSWRFAGDPALVERLASEVRLADCPEAERLVAWSLGPAPGLVQSAPRSELEFDRQVLGTVPALACDETDRAAAAWYLLARLGEDLRARDAEQPAWPAHRHDAAARALFADLFAGRVGVATGRQLRQLYAGAVKRAFAAVGTDLRLSSGYMEAKVAEALDALEFLAYDGGWIEVAIRMLEGTGEPVAVLARHLDPAGAEVVADCVAGRESWGATARQLHGELPSAVEVGGRLAQGADVHVFLRLLAHFQTRVPAGSGLGLPGWLVVTQNRGKVRGRLRQVLARDPARLQKAVLGLDAWYARSEAAFSRYAWDWAWREARAGFSFGAGSLSPVRCERPERQPTPAPAPPLPRAAVLTTVLLLVGRGATEDLVRWVNGDPSTTLSHRFYRYLSQAPDAVADVGTRSRSYLRLRNHLEDSLPEYFAEVAGVARRVAEVPVSARGMMEALAAALRPEWDPTLVPHPEHGSKGVREAFVAFLARQAVATPGGEP